MSNGVRRPRLGILLTMTLVGSLGVSGCGNAELDVAERMDSAREHRAEHELRAASIDLKNVLQAAPENADARFLLGQIYLDMGAPEAAEKELRRAEQYGRPEADVVSGQARALLEQGANERLLQEIKIDANWPKPVRATVAGLQAQALIASRRFDDAAGLLESADDLDPKNIEVQFAGIQHALVKDGPAAAVRLAEATVEAHSDSARAWTMLARTRIADAQPDTSEDALDKAIERAYMPLEQRLMRARLRLSRGAKDAAREDIEWLRNNAPEHPGVLVADGLLAWMDEDFEDACSSFDQAQSKAPDLREANFYAGVCRYRSGDYNQAAAYLEKARNGSSVPRIDRLLAAAYIAQGRYDSARSMLEPLLEADDEDTAALGLMARLEGATGNTGKAITHLRRLARLRPDDAGIRLQLGLGLLQSGDYEQGRTELDQALTVEPDLDQAGALVVLSHVEEGQYDKALAAADDMAQRDPEAALPWTLRGLTLRASGNIDAAQKAFEKAIEKEPADPGARHALARIALERGDLEAARRHYQAVLDQRPDHTSTLLQLAVVESGDGNPQRAQELLRRAHDGAPDALQPRLLLARSALGQRDPAAAIEWLQNADDEIPDQPQALRLAARARLQMDAPRQALEYIDRALKQFPDDPRAYVLAARAYTAMDQTAAAREQMQELLEVDPDNPLGLLIEARVQLREGEIDKARELLNRVPEQARKHPVYLDTRGELATRAGEFDKAVTMYRQAYKAAPRDSSAKALALALNRADQREEAVRLLASFVDDHPDAVLTNQTLGDLYTAQGRDDDAVQAYKAVIEHNPGAVDALNNLAWILRNDATADALGYAEHAASLRPEDPRVVDTFGMVLLKAGETEKAVRRLRDAVAQAPKAGILRFHLAQALVAAERPQAAYKQLDKALSGKAAFEGIEEARALRDKLATAQ